MTAHHIIELSACIAGLLFFFLSKQRKYKRFFLWLTIYVSAAFAADFGGQIYHDNISYNNGWLFNIYDILKYPLLFYLFGLINSLSSRFMRVCYGLYFLCLTIDIINLTTINDLLSFSTIAADIILIFLCLQYYYSLLKTPDQKSLLKYPYFWFANGVLFYFLCVLPYHILWTPMAMKQIDYDRRFYDIIINIAIFLHYACFSITFYLCRFQSRK
jgi:hypothetical protein